MGKPARKRHGSGLDLTIKGNQNENRTGTDLENKVRIDLNPSNGTDYI
jgi:hypothetical protein